MISSSSVITGTPNSCAFLDFDEPASSLQTRNDVFLDTLPVTLPPQSSIAFFALSRFSNLCREPVITNVLPFNASLAILTKFVNCHSMH